MPSRSAAKGRQPVSDRTRSASHALMPEKDNIASAPPASMTGVAPARIICTASAMAWLDEAQAEDTAKLAPQSPRSIATAEAAAFPISLGTVSGGTRDLPC